MQRRRRSWSLPRPPSGIQGVQAGAREVHHLLKDDTVAIPQVLANGKRIQRYHRQREGISTSPGREARCALQETSEVTAERAMPALDWSQKLGKQLAASRRRLAVNGPPRWPASTKQLLSPCGCHKSLRAQDGVHRVSGVGRQSCLIKCAQSLESNGLRLGVIRAKPCHHRLEDLAIA
jgi:hypothetical protein